MDRLQFVSTLAALGLLVVVLELVRRRRLLERYALLWLLAAIVILVLAVWRDALVRLAHVFGIVSAPNALFFIALGFILLLLLHFSAALSRLSDQSKVLAQQLALLDARLRNSEAGGPAARRAQEPLDLAAELERSSSRW